MSRKIFYIAIIASLVIDYATSSAYPIVTTVEGQLQGKSSESRGGRPFYEFVGIRYAQLGLRFQISDPIQPWEGVRNATEFGPACPTYYFYNDQHFFEGEEDCLFLNVYTPKLTDEDDLFPVMVFFHEGGFLQGSGKNYGAKYLMDEEIVIVTINYRLSALGFLSTEDEEASGNMGLKDQVKSLQWIQRNIQFFNGNPDLVTIFGYSAGGASVTYHLLSEMSQGLFHRAIAQSGSSLNPWAFAPRPLENAKILAARAGCPTNNSKEIISCLQEKDVKEILKLQRAPFVRWFVDPLYVFVPSVEKKVGDGSSNFLIKSPKEIVNSGEVISKVPLMTGCVKEDGLLLHGAIVAHDKALSQFMDFNWNFVAPITFFYDDVREENSTEADIISERIREFYFGSQNKSINWDTVYELSHAYSDRWFLKGVTDFARFYSDKGNNSVFNYITTYNKLTGEVQAIINTTEILDASHGDDVQLFFKSAWSPEITEDSEHYNISKTFVKLWVNFSKFGNPNAIQETGVDWTRLNTEESSLRWFHINEPYQMVAAEFTDRSDFWNSIATPQ